MDSAETLRKFGKNCGEIPDLLKVKENSGEVDSVTLNYGFFCACLYGNPDIVEYLLSDSRIGVKLNPGLSEAARRGHLEIVKLLMQRTDADPSWGEHHPGETLPMVCHWHNCTHDKGLSYVYATQPLVEIAHELLKDERTILNLQNLFKTWEGLTYKDELIKMKKRYPHFFEPASHYWLEKKPILAKYFEDLVAPEILKPYEHTMKEFDMF